MNILSIQANQSVQSDADEPYGSLHTLLQSVSTTQISAYRLAVDELRRKRFHYDAIITSFSADPLLNAEDVSALSRNLKDRAVPNSLRNYRHAFGFVSEILTENPFAIVVAYSAAGPAVAAAVQAAFPQRIYWVDKIGSDGRDWVQRDTAKLQGSILRGLTEYQLTLDYSGAFRVSQCVSRGPIQFATDIAAQNILAKPHFGSARLVYPNQLQEFEYLLNKPRTSEHELQLFLEAHPEVLLGNRYKSVRSHFHLIRERESKGLLIPDFILEPLSTGDFWKIVDLKLPSDSLAHELNNNRRGFGSKILAALRQLREYRDYFDDPQHRQRLADMGITAFKPELSVIIGRSYGKLSFEEIVKARTDFPGLEILTYQDLLERMRAMSWLY